MPGFYRITGTQPNHRSEKHALVLGTPVRCTVQPAALRVRVPRDRPGVPDPKPQINWNACGSSP